MGDDLIFAQRFTQMAADGLSCLSDMDDPRSHDAEPVVTAMMTQIQSGAKRLRARHIYQSAQGVLSALHHDTDAVLQGRIQALGNVVTHYATGLSELVDTPQAKAPKTVKDKWVVARATLDELLPHATPEDADALSRLMRAPLAEDIAPAAIEIESEVIAFSTPIRTDVSDEIELEEVEVTAEEIAPKTPAPIAQTTSIYTAADITLESLMRDVVADALSVARSASRTISLSYDMGETQLAEDKCEDLRLRLGRALARIIRESLPEGRVGHIDINAAGEQLHIMAGTTALRVAIDAADQPVQTPRPMITPETEDDLRAQLDALMDQNTPMQDAAS